MKNDESDVVRHIAWKEIFPWLIIFQSFRVAFCTRIILLALLAVCLVDLGWTAFRAGIRPETAARVRTGLPVIAVPYPGVQMPLDGGNAVSSRSFLDVTVMPWVELFGGYRDANNPLTWKRTFFLVLGGLWTLAVWAFFGGAISRIAAVRLARNEVVGLRASVRFAAGKWISYLVAPLAPIGAALVILLFAKLTGLTMRGDIGMIFAGIVWPIVLLCGFLCAILLTGLMVGWPLMWGTISVEGDDGFDSLSRMYSYVYQRPLNYFFYLLVAFFFGCICWIAVSFIAGQTIALSLNAAAVTAEAGRIGAIADTARPATFGEAPATALIGFWNSLVTRTSLAIMYAFFWAAMTAIYFLMRRDVDHCEMDEVYTGDAADTYDLPDLSSES